MWKWVLSFLSLVAIKWPMAKICQKSLENHHNVNKSDIWSFWPSWPSLNFYGHSGQKWPNPFSHNLDHYSKNSKGLINFWCLVWKLEPFEIHGGQKWVYAEYFWACVGILNFMHQDIEKYVSGDIVIVIVCTHFTSILIEIQWKTSIHSLA